MNRQHLNQNFVPNAFDMEIVDNTQFQADRGQQLGSTPKERLRQNTGASFAASINYDLARAEPFKGNTHLANIQNRRAVAAGNQKKSEKP